MKKRLFNHLNVCIRFLIIFFIVMSAKLTSDTKEFKIESVNENRAINLTTMALKLQEDIANDIYSAKDTYTGDLTGYTADCPLCSGHLSCASSYNVKNGTEIYPDTTYGNVRIVASSKNLPCGTIIRFNKSSISSDPVVAVVLDRGVLGNDIDLLTNDLSYAYSSIGRSTITYDILRTGW